MTLLTDDDHLTRLSFSIYENRGVYALLIGSGLSRAAQIPTGWEITLDLIRRVALAKEEKEQTNWIDWYKEKTGKEPSYSELVGELGLSQEERRAILHKYIEPTEEDREEGRKLPTAAHFAIADLVKSGYVRVIITTNFDRLLESAIRAKGIEPTVVASVDMLKGAEPLTHSSCYILKLHGDYKDSRILNTEEELSSYPAEYDAILDRILDEHGLVVCGWSSEWDHALRAAICRCPSRRYSMYWAARGNPSSDAQDLIAQRNGILFTIEGADAFLTNLKNRIETLAQTHRKNPQSVEHLVNSTKRFLRRPEYRIDLDDLLKSESHTLVQKLDDEEFSAHGELTATEFQRRVAFYEAVTEPLARMIGVIGRWGGEDEVSRIMDIIRFVYNRAHKENSGLYSWVSLQSYPAVLLVTSFGIGLVSGERWRALHLILSSQLDRGMGSKSVRIVEGAFLWSWDGGKNEYWQLLEGMERHKTALSDHLCELFETWGSSYLGVVPSFETLYETWEIMASIIYHERYSIEELQAAMDAGNRPGYTWAPVGRSGWNSQIRSGIIENIQSDELKQSILQASIGKGREDFLDTAIENYLRLAGRMQLTF